jgi:hypothetical protein
MNRPGAPGFHPFTDAPFNAARKEIKPKRTPYMNSIMTPAIERADKLILEAQTRVADLERRQNETEQTLHDAEGQATEALLRSGKLDANTAIRLRGELEVIARAIGAARARIPGLEAERRRVEASEARRIAGEKLAEAEGLEGECLKALAKLSEIQGVKYDHCILSAQRVGPWYPVFGGIESAAEYLGPHEVRPDPTGLSSFAVPRSRALRNEATELTQHAGKLETRAEALQQTPQSEAAAPVQFHGEQPERSILNPTRVNEPQKGSWYRAG